MMVTALRRALALRILPAFLGSALPAIAAAQGAAVLTGRIVDTAGAPIRGASVRVPQLERSVSVDSAGQFRLEGLPTGKVTIVGEAYMQVRHIYTDGRPMPADPDPTFNGTSIGHWEGDTLVVETAAFSDTTNMDRNTPHSDKMKIVERFRLTEPDRMTIETTVTDPEALTAPWTTTRTLARHRDWTTREYICEENNRNYVDAQGKAGINLKDSPVEKKE